MLNKKFMLLLLVIVVMFGTVSAASAAADVSVSDFNTTDDNGVNAVSAPDAVAEIVKDTSVSGNSGDHALSAASKDNEVNSVGATRNVNPGDFNDLKNKINNAGSGDILIVNGTYKFTETLEIKNAITIKASEDGATFNGNGNRIFKITSKGVNLEGIDFINARVNNSKDNDGAAIYVSIGSKTGETLDLNLNIINCNFINNSNPNAYGGAISIKEKNTLKNLNIINCSFENNSARIGGALRLGYGSGTVVKNVNITNCNFTNNKADIHGGATCFHVYNLNMSNCIVQNNSANFSGGINAHTSGLYWYNCTFIGNKAISLKAGDADAGYGGAISLVDDAGTHNQGYTIVDCKFYNNSAVRYGAGIEIIGNNTKIINCTMDGNTAPSGAGIHIKGVNASISYSTISNNNASDTGAGVWISGANAKIMNSTLYGNTATDGAGAYIEGNNAVFDNITALLNKASSGAGIYVKGDYAKILNSHINNNTAYDFAAGAYIDGSHITVENSVFEYNVADAEDHINGDGGALYVTGSDATVKYSNFTRNIARNGSAIYAKGSINIINDTFDRNQAWIYGIPIYANFTDVYGSLIGGDNILNAIHYQGELNEFKFTGMFNDEYKEDVTPVDGYKNSEDGKLVYCDDHEPYQTLTVTIYDSIGTEKYNNESVITDEAGDYSIPLTDEIKEGLEKGKYYVAFANYPETDYYKADNNNTIIGTPGSLYIEDIYMIEGDKDNKTFAGCLESAVTGQRIANATVTLTIYDKNKHVVDTFNVTTNDLGCFIFNKTLENLAYGNYTIYGLYMEGDKPLEYNATLTVDKLDVVLVANNQTSYPYENRNFTVNVTRDGVTLTDANGNLTIHTEVGNFTAPVINGVATFEDKYLITLGNQTVTMDYTSNYRYNSAKGNFTWEVIPIPAPTVVKVSNASAYDKVVKGNTILYTITVINNAPIEANFNVVDTLPTGLININSSDSGIYDGSHRTVSWNVNIGAGETKTFTIVATINASGINLTNTVIASNNVSNVSDSSNTTFHVDNLANITITKEVNVTEVHCNDEVQFTITVTNNGPNSAIAVKVNDILPDGLEYLNSVASFGSYDNNTGIWTVTDVLNPGVEARLIVYAKVLVSNSVLVNVANVVSNSSDYDENGNIVPNTNKSANATVTATKIVVAVASVNQTSYPYQPKDFTINVTDLEGNLLTGATGNITIELEDGKTVTKEVIDGVATFEGQYLTKIGIKGINPFYSGDSRHENATGNFNWTVVSIPVPTVNKTSSKKDKYIKGSEVLYTIVVKNNAPIDVNYTIVDTLPLGLILSSASGTYSVDGSKITWNVQIGANKTYTLTVSAIVNDAGVNLTNNVTVSSLYCSENVSDDDVITVDNLAEITITKDVNVTETVSYNDLVKFTITVTNNGQNASDVNVNDILPAGLEFVSASTATGTYNHVTGIWSIGNLTKTSVSLEIIAKVTKDNGTVLNYAKVTSPSSNLNEDGTISPTVDKQANASIEAKKLDVNLTTEDLESYPYELRNFTINVTDSEGNLITDANGTITVQLDNGDAIVIPVNAGVAKFNNKYYITLGTNIVDAIYSGDNRYNSANNTFNWKVNPIAPPTVTKEASCDGEIIQGSRVIYTISVFNNADIDAYFDVIDTLPNGLVYDGSSSTGAYDITTKTITWNIFVPSNTTVSIYVYANVTVHGVNLTNKVNVTNEASHINVYAENNITIDNLANVTITKDVNVTEAVAYNDLVEFTITVNNYGPDKAVDVKVSDILPAGLKYVSYTGDGTYDSESGIWTIDDLEIGSKSIKIVAKVIVSEANITNIATVTSPTSTYDKDGNIVPSINITDTASSDVEKIDVVIVDVDQKSYPYELRNFTINVTKDGVVLSDATGNITIELEGQKFTAEVINGVATFNDEFLTILGNHTITPIYSGDLRYNGATGEFTWEVIPIPNPDVVKVSNATDKVVKGDSIEYTITITNNANMDVLYNVVDNLPYGFVYTDLDGGVYDPISRTITWNVLIDANANKTFTIKGIANVSGVDLTNFVTVTNDSSDVSVTKNTTFHVDNLANIVIVKEVNATNVAYNDLVKFTITVTNYGQTASDVKVADLLPTGLVLISATPSVGTYNDGVWSIGDLGNIPAYITMVAKVNVSEANLTNIAIVTSPTSDIAENGTIVPNVNKSANATVNIEKIDIVIVDVDQKSYPYELRNFTVNVTKDGVVLTDATGNITIELEGQKFTAIVNNGVATFNDEFLTILGNHTITPIYSGDLRYNGATGEFKWEVIPIPNPTVVKVSNATDYDKVVKGDSISYTITIDNNAPIAVLYHVVDTLPVGFDYTGLDGGVYNATSRTVTWDVWIDANSNKVFTITGIANASGVDLTNTVVVSNETSEVSVTNTTTFHVDNLANITIIKVSNITDGETVAYGDLVEFTITVTNYGQTASDVKVADLLPAGLILISATPSIGTYSNGVWSIGDLGTTTESIVMIAKVDISEANLTNIATVTSPTSDIAEDGTVVPDVDKSANTTVNITRIDVELATEDLESYPYELRNFTVNVTDSEGNIITDATGFITVQLDSGDVTALVINGVATFDNKYFIALGNNSVNTIYYGNERYNPANTTFSWLVKPIADPSVRKESKYDGELIKGSTIVYTIYVTNNADIDAVFKVIDTLPTGLEFIKSNYAGAYNPETNTVLWTVNIPAGTVVAIDLTTYVNTSGVKLTNKVNVTNEASHINVYNDTNVTVDNLANVTIIKVSNITETAAFSDLVEFTINVTNYGPDAAINVTVDDIIPRGLVYVSSNATIGSYDNNTAIWTIGTLNNGVTASIKIIAKVVMSNGTIVNVGTVTSPSSTYDENGTVIPSLNKSTNTSFDVRRIAVVVVADNQSTHPYELINFTVNVTDSEGNVFTDARGYMTIITETGFFTVPVVNGTATFNDKFLITLGNQTITPIYSGDLRYLPATGEFTWEVIPIPDPGVVKDSNATDYEKVIKNSTISYNITIENNARIAVLYYVVDTLPEGFVYTGSSDNGVYDAETNTVTWNVWIDAFTTKVLTITGIVNASGVNLTNTVSVSNASSNVTVTNTTTFAVDNLADVNIIKIANVTIEDVVAYDDIVGFIIFVYNNGPDSAINVTVDDILPDGVSFINSTSTVGEYNATSGVWYIGTLENNTYVALKVVAKVVISNGTVINVATVTSPTSTLDENGTVVPSLNKSDNATFNVRMLNTTTLTPENVTGKFGQNVNIPVEVIDERGDVVPFDNVTVVYPDGTEVVIPVIEGQITIDIPYDFINETNLTIKYPGDNTRYNPSQNNTIIFVNKLNVTATTENATVKPGHNVTIPINVTDENGNPVIVDNVTVTFPNGNNITVPVVDGEFVIDVPKWVQPSEIPEQWTITVPETYNTLSTSVISNVTILKLDTTTITPENVTGKQGQKVIIPVEVYDELGDKVNASQVLVVYPNGTEVLMDVVNDTIIIDIPYGFENGTTLDIKYPGDDRYNPSANNTTVFLDKLNVIIDIPEVHGIAGEKVSIDITVVDENGVPVNNANLTVVLPDGSNVTVPIINGIAKVTFTLPKAGTYKLYAFMEETDMYYAAQNESNVFVEAPEEPITPGIPMQHTGNPIFAILLVLFALPILRRKL
ncbi:MAG: hypothetical protein Q4P14_00710 [Methanobacteriaceae archaeon]|nr:hypothetical protein [Methanobacteriaceae archaeon]